MITTLDVPIKDLKLYDDNPRTISKCQFDKLVSSIQHDPNFLYLRPVLVNRRSEIGDLEVYAGNQRVRAAKKLKHKTIPCIIEDDLEQSIIDERCIKDNKTYGEWNWDMLSNNWSEDLLSRCGFDVKELDISNDISKIDLKDSESEEEKPKKCKLCPHCGKDI